MSFRNFLDLRKKTQQQTRIIERVVFRSRSLKSNIFLALSVILVASAVIWGITKADILDIPNREDMAPQNFSASGIVSNISSLFGTNIIIENAKGSDDSGKTTYSFNLNQIIKIENTEYVTLSVSDIKVGDKIVVQGLIKDTNIIEAYRIISFATSTQEKLPEIATSTATTTATSTPETENASSTNATSTDEIASSTLLVIPLVASSSDERTEQTETSANQTMDSNTLASTTEMLPDFLTNPKAGESASQTPPTLTEVVEEVVQKVVDTFTDESGSSQGATENPPAPEQAI